MKIAIRHLSDAVEIPEFATPGSAALDLQAAIPKPLRIGNGATELIPTGIALHIADPQVAGFLYARSGLSVKEDLVLANDVGVIDSDYQDQIFVALRNRGFAAKEVHPGQRIAQIVFQHIIRPEFQKVDDFSEQTGRGGFGSTGKQGKKRGPGRPPKNRQAETA